jgi:hypothetical protein
VFKADIAELRSATQTAIAELKADVGLVRGEIRDVEVRLTRAIMTQTWAILGGVAAIAGLVAVLSRLFH